MRSKLILIVLLVLPFLSISQVFKLNNRSGFSIKTPSLPDTTPPVITLLGNAVINITQGAPYSDIGATAIDDVDGDITANNIGGFNRR